MNEPRRRALVMVWDGMRPDFVTPELTPNLDRLASEGVRFTDSHAVFPTVTRANSATIATGLLPALHGIPSNMFHAPGSTPNGLVNAGSAADLECLRPLRGGRVLLAPTLAERIAKAGGRTAVVSTGSPGSCLLQHPEAAACGDIMLHTTFQTGVALGDLERRLDPMPGRTMPNTAQNAWFTRAITEVLLPGVAPDLLVFWHTDPDHTQHQRGIGHPDTLRAIRDADDHLGAILQALDRLGLRGETNVVVTSDHGFSTISDRFDLKGALVEAELLAGDGRTDEPVLLPDMVYVPGRDPERVRGLVAAMARVDEIGPLFSAQPDDDRSLPLSLAGADGPAGPDVLFSPAWSDAANEYGHAGTVWATGGSYPASHGSISPWEIRNTLIAAGPDFKRGVVSAVPAGNIDITPTLLHLFGLERDTPLDGRVLREALTGGPEPASVPVERAVHVREADGRRRVVHVSSVGRTRYVDSGRVEN
jgi:arylsulfatase A-like enzyme